MAVERDNYGADQPSLWESPSPATSSGIVEHKRTTPQFLLPGVPTIEHYPRTSHFAPEYQRKIALLHQAGDIIDAAMSEYDVSNVFVLFSGGYDSLVTTHFSTEYLQKNYPGIPWKVVHINTGIGIEKTREYVRGMQLRYDWPYAEYKTHESYERLVLANGFPGPAAHSIMYAALKERPLRELIRDHTPQQDEIEAMYLEILRNYPSGVLYATTLLHALVEEAKAYKKEKRKKMLFLTGVRRQESQRRMGYVQPIQREKRRIWVAPLTEWTKDDIRDYMDVRSLPHNEVVDTTHKSGECLCGAFAHPGELAEIDVFYPEVGKYIHELEEKAHDAGFHWGWEERPPAWYQQQKGQEALPGLDGAMVRHLCASCDARFAAQQEYHHHE